MIYDNDNIFAKILRGEIPCDKVYEDNHVLAFNDINAQAPKHVLVIPKGTYVTHEDFSANASDEEIIAFTRAISKIINKLGLNKAGSRTISNSGVHGGQEVPHYHLHILGGHELGRMVE